MLGLGKKKTFWTEQTIAVIVVVAMVFFAAGYLYKPAGGSTITGALTSQEASNKALDFINTNMLAPGMSATLNSVDEQNGLYVINISVGDEQLTQDYESFVTKDGGMLFVSGVDLNQEIEPPAEQAAQAQAETPQVPQAARPYVELFVMSHCPYGTQMEKGIIPVVELLGDRIDFAVKFVFYAMHGKTELDEQLLQHCVQEAFPEAYLDYLKCFLQEGKSDECVTETGLDRAVLDACIQETDTAFNVTSQYEDQSTWLSGRFPLFDVDKEDNEKYEVGGSPHLVINGATVSAGRDPSSLLAAVCGAFTQAPGECSSELSSETPAPGFGFEGSGAATEATCG